MNTLVKARFETVNDGPFFPPPRLVPIVSLSQPKKVQRYWWIPTGLLTLLIGAGIGAGALWGNHSLWSLPVSFPDVEAMIAMPDVEANAPGAETMMPPPSDVVIPVPIVAALPASLEKVIGNDVDLSAGIAIPASSLQVIDGLAQPQSSPSDQQVAALASKLTDLPALSPTRKKSPEVAHIAVERAHAQALNQLVEEAQARLDEGDEKGALWLYNRVLKRDSKNQAALAGRAFLLQKTGQYDAAINTGRRLLTIDPSNETARGNLMMALGESKSPEALKELKQEVAIKPNYAPAQIALAQALARDGNTLEALSHAEQAAELEPDNIYYQLGLAVMYDQLGHSGEAVTLYRQVLGAAEASKDETPALPVSVPAIRKRVSYLEKLMASVELAPTTQE